MEKSIKLTLFKPLILESVKNETFIKGNFDKAVEPKALTAAYVEQAGNEAYHDRILLRTLETSLGELKTQLSDYLVTMNGTTSGDNISSSEDGDKIYIILVVGDRFNFSYTDTLAKLCAKYVEETMLMDWWRPINEKQSALYATFIERDLVAIKKCFNKTAPKTPTIPYTQTIELTGSAVDIGIGEEQTISYTLSAGAIDDIEIRVADEHICKVGRTEEGFTVEGVIYGHTSAEIYSRHNPEARATVEIYVSIQD